MAKYSKIKSKVHPIAYIIGAIFLAIIVVVIVVSVPKRANNFIEITLTLKSKFKTLIKNHLLLKIMYTNQLM